MIEPNTEYKIEHQGHTFRVGCLTRSKLREIVLVMAKLQGLEASSESVAKVFDLADELLELCLPGLSEAQREMMTNEDIFEIAGKVLSANTLDTDAKKKSESRPSSEQVSYAKVAVPDVLSTTWGS